MKHLFITAMLAAACTSALALDMKAGRWEVTTTATMEGMPMPMQPRTSTQTQCMKPEDAVIEPPKEEGVSCQMVENDASGSTVKWRMACTMAQGGTMDAEGQIDFAGDSMSGHMTMTGNMQGMSITMKHEYTGRRIGDC